MAGSWCARQNAPANEGDDFLLAIVVGGTFVSAEECLKEKKAWGFREVNRVITSKGGSLQFLECVGR